MRYGNREDDLHDALDDLDHDVQHDVEHDELDDEQHDVGRGEQRDAHQQVMHLLNRLLFPEFHSLSSVFPSHF